MARRVREDMNPIDDGIVEDILVYPILMNSREVRRPMEDGMGPVMEL